MKTDLNTVSMPVSRPTRAQEASNAVAEKSVPKEKQGFSEFNTMLVDKLAGEGGDSGLQFSAHAIQRMAERKIELSSGDMQKIREALAKVGEKGARESLILSAKGAFIVDVREKRVITAVDPETARDSTFTNIDSTVII